MAIRRATRITDVGAGSRDRTDTPVKEQVFETCASTNSAMPARPVAITARSAFANMGVLLARDSVRREDISQPMWPGLKYRQRDLGHRLDGPQSGRHEA